MPVIRDAVPQPPFTLFEVVEDIESIHAHPGDVIIESHETGNLCVFHTARANQLTPTDRRRIRELLRPVLLAAPTLLGLVGSIP